MRTLLPVVALLTALFAVDASAQGSSPDPLSDDRVHKFLMLALDNIGQARCENNAPCAAATAEEKANPPITIEEARLVVRRAVLSGIAGSCNLDWQKRNFLPMMAYWRSTKKKTERQMALITLVHGIMQGMMESSTKACPAEMREKIDAQLTFKP